MSLAATAGAVFGGRALLRGVSGVLRAWGQQEEAVQSLRAALMVMGHEGEGALAVLTKRAAELQAMTTKGDEAIIAATASLGLLAPALSVDELAKAQEAMIGIADTFLKGDLQGAALAVGKTVGSATSAVSRYGIIVDIAGTQSEKLNEILDQTTGLFDVSKARTDTLNGALAQMSNAWGDVKESIGRVLEQKTGLTDFLQGVTRVMADVATGLQGTSAQIVAVFRNLGVIAANAFSLAVVAALTNVPRMFRDMFEEMTKTGPKLLFPINAALREAAEGWRLIFEAVFSGVGDEARANIEGAVIALGEIAKAVEDAIKKGAPAAAAAADDLTDDVTKELSVLEQAGVSAGESLIRGFIQGTDNLTGLLVSVMKQIATQFIIGKLNEPLEKESPSKAAARAGQNTVLGYIKGLKDAATAIPTAVGGAFALASPAVAGAGAGGGTVVHQDIHFNMGFVDGGSGQAWLKANGSTIAQIIFDAAQDGAGFRRGLRGR